MRAWTYHTADNHGCMVGNESGDADRHDFNNDESTEDANKGPKRRHQVAHRRGLILSIAKEPGDGIREMLPWRRW